MTEKDLTSSITKDPPPPLSPSLCASMRSSSARLLAQLSQLCNLFGSLFLSLTFCLHPFFLSLSLSVHPFPLLSSSLYIFQTNHCLGYQSALTECGAHKKRRERGRRRERRGVVAVSFLLSRSLLLALCVCVTDSDGGMGINQTNPLERPHTRTRTRTHTLSLVVRTLYLFPFSQLP